MNLICINNITLHTSFGKGELIKGLTINKVYEITDVWED